MYLSCSLRVRKACSSLTRFINFSTSILHASAFSGITLSIFMLLMRALTDVINRLRRSSVFVNKSFLSRRSFSTFQVILALGTMIRVNQYDHRRLVLQSLDNQNIGGDPHEG